MAKTKTTEVQVCTGDQVDTINLLVEVPEDSLYHTSGRFKGLRKGIEYPLGEDGRINWLELIPKKYIVPNKAKTEETDISKLTPDKLLMLLPGFEFIADLRGFKANLKAPHSTVSVNNGYFTSALCTSVIRWNPIYDTNFQEIETSELGNANLETTQDSFQNYINEIAGNRAFVRNVRLFLRIPMLGKDELPPDDKKRRSLADAIKESNKEQPVVPTNAVITTTGFNGHEAIERKLNKYKITFERFKNSLTRAGHADADNWLGITDIPQDRFADLLDFIEDRVAALKLAAERKEAEAAKAAAAAKLKEQQEPMVDVVDEGYVPDV